MRCTLFNDSLWKYLHKLLPVYIIYDISNMTVQIWTVKCLAASIYSYMNLKYYVAFFYLLDTDMACRVSRHTYNLRIYGYLYSYYVFWHCSYHIRIHNVYIFHYPLNSITSPSSIPQTLFYIVFSQPRLHSPLHCIFLSLRLRLRELFDARFCRFQRLLLVWLVYEVYVSVLCFLCLV